MSILGLNPSVASTAIAAAYQDASGTDENGRPLPGVPAGDYPADFATAYDEYAKQGVVVGAINLGGDKSIIENCLRNGFSGSGMVIQLAEALRDYWATVALIPAPGFVSVSNDAMSILLYPFWIMAVEASITGSESKPYFSDFISNVQSIAVEQVTWTAVPAT
jgi:hypothetical protein